jgi:hypothetical protein
MKTKKKSVRLHFRRVTFLTSFSLYLKVYIKNIKLIKAILLRIL